MPVVNTERPVLTEAQFVPSQRRTGRLGPPATQALLVALAEMLCKILLRGAGAKAPARAVVVQD